MLNGRARLGVRVRLRVSARGVTSGIACSGASHEERAGSEKFISQYHGPW